ncbi:hypothetical protein SAMN05414139_04607 [Burkholderia sp. D7]|nr:hypothetical protein SAMN05414139_04607 [Burkholderia sp. D7]
MEDRDAATVFPCALVFIDVQATGSPNFKSKNPLSYVRQAICLNKSLLHAGLPRLNVFTNAVDLTLSQLADTPQRERPIVHELEQTMEVPERARFYAAHFKLDLLAQAAHSLGVNEVLLLLDTDMAALRSLDGDLLRRCQNAGVGAFDISDQVFPAYGSKHVIADLETVAGRELMNPRWYGGEFLLATRPFLDRLVPRARQHYKTYVQEIHRLNHQGDEVFVSTALNTLADEGQPIVEVGAYQAIGRHWAGNTHRDLRWFRGCCFLHLSGAKTLFEKESWYRDFSPHRFWLKVSAAHRVRRIFFVAKLYLKH